jgi:glycine cleavage system aminomethyltransferase T
VLLNVSDQSLDKSPFFDAAHRAGASRYIVLNHMFMPYGFGDLVDEYWSLVNDVTLWDVAAERQVEVAGPDAARFVDLIVARNLENLLPGQCRYVVMTDETGAIINDPVLARLEDNVYWLSAADADILLWCKGAAAFAGLNVTIRQPDVAPVQIQGAKSREVVGALFGQPALALRYYHLLRTELNGIPVVLTRTGWSGDLGYEIYLCDTSRARELWDLVLEAGRPHRIRVTGPNTIRRVEAGIIAMRSDIPLNATPYHVGLERLVDLSKPADFVGKAALRKIARKGVSWSLVSLAFDENLPHAESATFGGQPVLLDGKVVGETTVVVHSPRVGRMIGFARADSAAAGLGTGVFVDGKHGRVGATVVTRPFFDPGKAIAKA